MPGKPLKKNNQKNFAKFRKNGVIIVDPLTTYIAEGVHIGKNTTIQPLTVIEADVRIGENCNIGPFARIRKGVTIKNGVTIGNFVEIVRSHISNNARIKHLTYIGDATIEDDVNIGAGTIVANYDGKHKHKTLIKRKAFIGSGTILIAPINIGQEAITGAGAVVTKHKDVPDKSVVIGMPARILK